MDIKVENSRNTASVNLLTPHEVACWLGVSVAWVRDHATRKQPHLPTVRLGKLIRFRTEEIEQFLVNSGVYGIDEEKDNIAA